MIKLTNNARLAKQAITTIEIAMNQAVCEYKTRKEFIAWVY